MKKIFGLIYNYKAIIGIIGMLFCLVAFQGCDQAEMPNIGGIVGPEDELYGCEGANLYDWDDLEFTSSLDQDEDIWIAFDLDETTLFSVHIDQAGFQCSIFEGCNGEWGEGNPIFQFESIGNGVEVGIVNDGIYWLNILNTRNRVDFTFSINLNTIVIGCMDETAENYNPDANVADGSCIMQDCTVDYYVDAYGDWASNLYFPMMNDCDGNCTPESWLGDTFCDDGAWGIYGPDGDIVPVNLICEELQWDLGDCEIVPGECDEGQIEDCNDNCAPDSWVGDGFCDDGSYEYNGNQIFFNCEEFNNDGGDCDEGLNRQIQQPKYPNGRIPIGQ